MARPAVNPTALAVKSAPTLSALAGDLRRAAQKGDVSVILATAKDIEAVGCRLRRAATKAGG